MTPCEKLGYKVGDEFEVVNPAPCALERKGVHVKLVFDDGSNNPYFYPVNQKDQDGFSRWCFSLSSVRPLPITLSPGDYVSTDGITDTEYHAVAAAFMAAGAEKGGYLNWDFVTKTSADSFGWLTNGGLYHHLSSEFKRHLAISQVLNATNAQGKTPQQGPKSMSGKDGEKLGVKRTVTINITGLNAEPQQDPTTMTTIDTLHEAKRQRDEAAEKLETAEAVLNVALDAVRAELGEGFDLNMSGAQPAEDMNDPAHWRAGDVVRATTSGADFNEGWAYVIKSIVPDGCYVVFKDDAGDTQARRSDHFAFVRRP